MNNKKKKNPYDFSRAYTAFLRVGLLFLALGVLCGGFGWGSSAFEPSDQFAFRMTFIVGFGLMGLMMVLIFGTLLANIRQSKQFKEKLRREGHFVIAKVMEIHPNFEMIVDDLPALVLRCTYEHSDGSIYGFESENLPNDPKHPLDKERVVVWVSREDYALYDVDVERDVESMEQLSPRGKPPL